jgi:hypothetical protein
MTEWNGRRIQILTGNTNSIFPQAPKPKPAMARPSNVEAEVTGGYSQERGSYIEAKVSASWGDSKPSSPSSSSDSKSAPSDSTSKDEASNDPKESQK